VSNGPPLGPKTQHIKNSVAVGVAFGCRLAPNGSHAAFPCSLLCRCYLPFYIAVFPEQLATIVAIVVVSLSVYFFIN